MLIRVYILGLHQRLRREERRFPATEVLWVRRLRAATARTQPPKMVHSPDHLAQAALWVRRPSARDRLATPITLFHFQSDSTDEPTA